MKKRLRDLTKDELIAVNKYLVKKYRMYSIIGEDGMYYSYSDASKTDLINWIAGKSLWAGTTWKAIFTEVFGKDW
jgi:hypothetical protein